MDGPSRDPMSRLERACAGDVAPPAGGSARRAGWRHLCAALRLLCLVAIAGVLLATPFDAIPAWLAQRDDGGLALLVAACLAYALLLALPFVPSVELGLLIMIVFGRWGAVGAYLATVAGLNMAYGVARLLAREPTGDGPRLPAALRTRLPRAGARLPAPAVPVIGLALLLNLPGNTAVGGGGGIALLYGARRSLSWPRFALTVAAATAMLPALFLLGLV